MLVIADTSALVAVAACDGLEWLDELFTEVHVPRAVFQEATVPGKPQADKLKTYLQGKVFAIDLDDFVIKPYLAIIQQSDAHLGKDLIAHALRIAGE